MSSFYKFAFRKSTVIRGFKISLLVGSILNIINQGDMIFNADLQHINFFKICLTYIVPYLVSTYSTASALVAIEPDLVDERLVNNKD